MSPKSGRHRVILGMSVLACVGVVVAVHWQQRFERDTMHKGVLRDMERQKLKAEAKRH